MTPAVALAALALASGCAPAAPLTIAAGHIDPERIAVAGVDTPADQCATRKLASLPVETPGLPVVPATINARPASLILDTGAENTLLTAAAARRLGVTTRYDFVRSMRGIGRSVRTGDARLASMRLGGLPIDYPRALVGEVTFPLKGATPDGLLGASLLSGFDLDLDMPHRRLDLYAPTQCPDIRPPWRTRSVSLQTTRSLTEHPFFPITINGRQLTATLDTGAQRTVIAARSAAAAGIGLDSVNGGVALNTQGAAGELVPARLITSHVVAVGGVRLNGPVLIVPAALPRDIDALVGFDFLLQHRVYLSYGSRRLFVEESGPAQ